MINQSLCCNTCKNTECFIRKNCLVPEAEKIIQRKNTIRCKKSQQFIIEGSLSHGLFFVYEGKVKVAKTGLNGREQILRFAHSGEIIGHRGFGVCKISPVSAIALEDSILCNFTNDDLISLFNQVPSFSLDLMLFYAEELNKSENKVKKFAQMTVREKVIDALLYIARKFGQTDGYLNLTLLRKEIADFAGTTDEQVIRVISSLKKENFIQTMGKKIGIINIDLLKKEISEHNFYLGS